MFIEILRVYARSPAKLAPISSRSSQSNFNFWTTHPGLSPYVESGQLDFAIFDAVNDTKLSLHFAKKTISADNPTKNPICVVANYLFDTLCHDVFQVKDGVLKEGLISVGEKLEDGALFFPWGIGTHYPNTSLSHTYLQAPPGLLR